MNVHMDTHRPVLTYFMWKLADTSQKHSSTTPYMINYFKLCYEKTHICVKNKKHPLACYTQRPTHAGIHTHALMHRHTSQAGSAALMWIWLQAVHYDEADENPRSVWIILTLCTLTLSFPSRDTGNMQVWNSAHALTWKYLPSSMTNVAFGLKVGVWGLSDIIALVFHDWRKCCTASCLVVVSHVMLNILPLCFIKETVSDSKKQLKLLESEEFWRLEMGTELRKALTTTLWACLPLSLQSSYSWRDD